MLELDLHSDPIPEPELTILNIFKSVLKCKGLGFNDNFFEFGGTSLKATQIISKIHKELNVKLQLRKLFTHSTVAELAAIIKNAEQDTYKTIEPVPKQDNYPVSHAQRRLWILDQLNQGQTAFLINKAFILQGDFNIAHFKSALEKLIERHESLRTNFILFEGEPRQKINEFLPGIAAVNYRDIRNEPEKGSLLKELIEEEIHTPFDLATDTLVRVHIIQIEDLKYALFLSLHHIIADGWSMEIIIKDIIDLYNALKSQQPLDLAPLRIQYKDFAAWQNELLRSPDMDEHRDYWLNLLLDLPVIDLPTDHPRPAVRTEHGDKVHFDLGAALSDKIYAISKTSGTSAFTTLLTITNLLLSKYSGQTDIIIGSSTAGRDHVELENQVGIYANTLFFRSKFKEEDSFEELLANTKEVTLNAYEHQSYPFDRILEDLDVPRDFGRSPIFDVNIELDDIDVDLGQDAEVEDLSFSFYDRDMQTSKYDLSFRYNADTTIYGSIEYNTDLFDKPTIERLAEHIKQIVFAVDANMKLPVYKLDYLDKKEKQQLLVDFNKASPVAGPPLSIQEGFESAADKFFNDPAVRWGSTQLTYGELNKKANALAFYLRSKHDLQPNDKVGIMAGRSDRMVVALWGILKAGAAFVPISPEFPRNRIDFIIEDAGIKLMITDSEFVLGLADNSAISLFVLDIELDSLDENDANSPEIATGNDLAYIIYTSGSTGNPKGVEIERRSLANYINWANSYYFDNTPGKTFSFFTSLSFDLTMTCIFSTLLRGDNLVISTQEDTNEILKEIFSPGSEIDVVKMTPSHISLLKYAGLSETRVSRVIAGGEALTGEQISVLRNLNGNIKIYNEYGPSEATVGCVVKEMDNDTGVILIGKPAANAQIYILDKNLNLLPIGAIGEIYIGGECVARGYVNNAGLTSRKFIGNPFGSGSLYKTGDAARWRPNGEIEFLGRNAEQVKIAGYRV